MTQQQLVELVKQHHPHMGETEIRLLMDRAQDIFCLETSILEKTFVQTTTIDKRYYVLDDEISKIKKVYLDNVEIPRLLGKPAIDDDEFS
tara:strand:+ start:140 stop:409 length:270 start_codon:yes stop_codon:yes gene_type:complete